jgi:repressor LexA
MESTMNETDKKDAQGYAFIRSSILSAGITPSLRDIADTVGYRSRHSAEKMLARLEEKGLVTWSKGVLRLSPRTPVAEQTVDVPLVGSVACGLPSLAEQDVEALIPISTRIARPGHMYFLLRAVGTSMNKSGINDGDLVLVRQQSSANDGEKVVALINDEATIKHLHHEEGVIVLKPNSTDSSHKPIVLSDEFIIQGVVAATLPANLY